MTAVRRFLAAIAWLAAVLVIALGAAGIVTGMGAEPDVGARADLTARGDRIVSTELDAAEMDLRRLADDVAALSMDARAALAALNGSDLKSVAAAVETGDELVSSIRDRSRAVREGLATIPLIGTPEAEYQLSGAVRDRHARLLAAAGATSDLDAAWARLTMGSLAATRLSASLAAHDDAVLKAAEQGRNAKYDAAVATLADADAAIAEARSLRNQLAATVDVAILDQWLDRNADYDAALRDLYLALRDVKGRVTQDVRDAIATERAAKDRLPPDSRGLIVIMAEIGRGGMNRAVITIEEARGRLADALTDVAASASPGVMPSAVPEGPTSTP